jgi:adenosylcobyric acid synthase
MGQRITGYEIHHGRTKLGTGAAPWVHLDGEEEGAIDLTDASVLGTSLHGLFEQDSFRATFLTEIGRRRDKVFVPAGVSFAAARQAQFDRLADLLEDHLDMAAIERLIGEAA